jgi:hypothetical protein
MMRRAALLVLLVPLAAGAAPKKKQAEPPKAQAAPKANEKAVSELMGPYRWGMTQEEVLGAIGKVLNDRLAPELLKISDVYEQTRMRRQVKEQVDVVRKSLVSFNGQKTGWDVSIVEGEFLHNDDESMMLYRESDPATGRQQDRFFFFQHGKLWKQFIAFDMTPYKGKTFNDFRDAMEARYGKGTPIVKKGPDAQDHVVAVTWRAGGTDLRAVDLMQFYANFCLAFSDDAVEKQMEAARLARLPKVPTPRATVSDAKGGDKINDPNADVIDRITAGQKEPANMPAPAPASQPSPQN